MCLWPSPFAPFVLAQLSSRGRAMRSSLSAEGHAGEVVGSSATTSTRSRADAGTESQVESPFEAPGLHPLLQELCSSTLPPPPGRPSPSSSAATRQCARQAAPYARGLHHVHFEPLTCRAWSASCSRPFIWTLGRCSVRARDGRVWGVEPSVFARLRSTGRTSLQQLVEGPHVRLLLPS